MLLLLATVKKKFRLEEFKLSKLTLWRTFRAEKRLVSVCCYYLFTFLRMHGTETIKQILGTHLLLKNPTVVLRLFFLLGVSVKIQIGLPFWYRLTRVVPDTGPLNGCVCVCVCVCVCRCVCYIFTCCVSFVYDL